MLPHDFEGISAGLKSKWDESCISNLKIQYFGVERRMAQKPLRVFASMKARPGKGDALLSIDKDSGAR